MAAITLDRALVRRALQRTAGVMTALVLLAAPALANPPNIVLILADDLGGPFGGQGVPTPEHIRDRQQRRGLHQRLRLAGYACRAARSC